MEETTRQQIEEILARQRTFFSTGRTRDLSFRKEQLNRLETALKRHEKRIAEALWVDLHKSFEEAYLTEFSLVYGEICMHRRNLHGWAKPQRVKTPLPLKPSTSRIYYEPLGVSLIMAPWNYPFQLLINPLVGAISSGCCAILKPSPYTPNVAGAIDAMIKETFDPDYIAVVEGNRETNAILFEQRFDFIFYSGSTSVGKVVMRAAAEYLTPLVLELGGKSPCIVDADARLDAAANRIAWGKTINAGQTCIAPDYLLVHRSVKEALLRKIGEAFDRMYGRDASKSPHFGRIVSDQSFNRLTGLLKDGHIVYGGQTDAAERYISPTLIDGVDGNFPIMEEEIFGPLLPVLTFDHIDEAIGFVNSREKPLAFYYFGTRESAAGAIARTAAGGGCINDTVLHIANKHLPFGGVGNSGMGKYHGRDSFRAFSNARSVVNTPSWIELPLKYAPYRYFSWIKRIL